ncbi:unnamed protein product [Parajaminaea phylloscopi]
MPRSSSNHSKGKSDHGHAAGFVVPGWSIRGGSRRSSKVSASDDGHTHLPPAPSFSDSPAAAKGPDRHTRMKLAMAEAQQDPLGGHNDEWAARNDAARQHAVRLNGGTHGAESPRQKIAAEQAEAKAQAAIAHAQAAAARGDIEDARAASTRDRPGEGTLTFDVLGNAGDVVLADGIPPTPTAATHSNAAAKSASAARGRPDTGQSASSSGYHPGSRVSSGQHDGAVPGVLTDSPVATRHGTLESLNSSPQHADSVHGRAVSEASHLPPKSTQSLLVPGDEPATSSHHRSRTDHLMTPSQSTSALLPLRTRKVSDASSAGGRDAAAPAGKSKKGKAASGGIASALAASGAGMAGMGVLNPVALAEAHAKAAAEAAASGKKAPQQVSKVDENFVGGSQGGVYRDPASGLVTEKDERGRAVRQYSSRSLTMSRQSSAASLTESEGSSASGLGAAANFSAMQANALLTPTLGLGAGNAHGAPTTALDSSNAETLGGVNTPAMGSPRPDGAAGKNGGNSADAQTTASTGVWPSDVGSQITGFAVASSKRNADFHALFPTVPDDDYLIEDYGCALVREVFVQGRLYVSENHVCFFANIFGWVTNIALPFSDIVSIEKRMTALIIPNAIQIATLHAKHTFSSLLSRDTTFDLMANIWKLSHPDVPVTGDADGSDDEHSDAEDGDDKESKAGDERRGKVSKRAMLRKKLKGVTGSGAGGKDGAAGGGSASADIVAQRSGSTSTANGRGDTGAAGGEAGKQRKVKHPATQCPCDQDKKHLSTIALDTTYPTTPAKVFDLLFRSDFMKTFWTDNQKLMDLEVGPWKGDEGSQTRDFSYIKPLSGGFGPKQTKCVIVDEEQHVDFDNYVTVLTTTRTPDVPSGGSFSVKTRTCLTWKGNGNFTKVYVTCATEWTARSMLRGVIDKASIDGQKGYYKDLDAEITKHIKTHAADYKEPGDDDDDGGAEATDDKGGKDADGTANGGAAAAQNGDNKTAETASSAGSKTDTASTMVSTVIDFAQDAATTVKDIVAGSGLSPSMLALVAVVALLLVSNIWALSSSGAGRGQQRDPLDPHRLKNWQSAQPSVHSAQSGSYPASSPDAVAHAVRDVLKDYLEPLLQQQTTYGRRGASSSSEALQRRPRTDPCEEAAELKRIIDDVEERLQELKKRWEEVDPNRQRSPKSPGAEAK